MTPYFSDTVFVFDLDDTLYPEIEYVRSCFGIVDQIVERDYGIRDSRTSLEQWYRAGSEAPIQLLWEQHGLPTSERQFVIDTMRAHSPTIHLFDDAARLLEKIRSASIPFAIVTDGRSITQRAKLQALNCLDAAYISISEETGLSKTDSRRFLQVTSFVPSGHYVYIGDNPAKDFWVPNLLGWKTIMRIHQPPLVHSQNLSEDIRANPDAIVRTFDEICL